MPEYEETDPREHVHRGFGESLVVGEMHRNDGRKTLLKTRFVYVGRVMNRQRIYCHVPPLSVIWRRR